MAFNKDYCTKLSKVENNLDQYDVNSSRSNAAFTELMDRVKCAKYKIRADLYSN
jgi:hypothetical protein